MASDPSKVAKEVGGEIEEIVNNPEAFAEKMLEGMEKKALDMIETRVKKIMGDKSSTGELIRGIIAIFQEDN